MEVYLDFENDDIIINNCTFHENKADNGQVLYLHSNNRYINIDKSTFYVMAMELIMEERNPIIVWCISIRTYIQKYSTVALLITQHLAMAVPLCIRVFKTVFYRGIDQTKGWKWWQSGGGIVVEDDDDAIFQNSSFHSNKVIERNCESMWASGFVCHWLYRN